MNKIIIDITYLAHWNGRLTGIPRVIDEIARRYNNQPNAVFVIWDDRVQKFFQTDLNRAMETRGEKIYYSKNGDLLHTVQNTVARYFGFGTFYRLFKKAGSKFDIALFTNIAQIFINIRYASNLSQTLEEGDTLFVPMGIWHSSFYIDMIKKSHKTGVKIAQISYDMLPIVTPQYSNHSTESMLRYAEDTFPISDVIFSISEYTKADIEEWLSSKGLRTPRLEVFRLGDDFKTVEVKDSKRLEKTGRIHKKKYILCVGTLELRKNHMILYYVYRLAALRGITLPLLVIVGRKGWQGEGIYDLATEDPVVKKSMMIVTDASDGELSWLYTNAKYTIYPSFYEGWGLPVAESIAYGVPVLASRTSSIPEIAGDLIEYFDPISAEDILNRIQYMEDPRNLAKSVTKIKQYKPTTWDQTFSQINQGIKRLYEEN